MDFKDQILQLSDRIKKQKDSISTEEATKNAFIMPLIASLGYDVFNPFEVVPEMDCDLIRKKGEKIDYAIMKDENPFCSISLINHGSFCITLVIFLSLFFRIVLFVVFNHRCFHYNRTRQPYCYRGILFYWRQLLVPDRSPLTQPMHSYCSCVCFYSPLSI